MGGERGEEKDG